MSNSVNWLGSKIRETRAVNIFSENCLSFTLQRKKKIVYCPTGDEYEITIAIVQKAISEDADMIAYPSQWCRVTAEAEAYAENKITILTFSELLSKIR